MRKFTEAQPRWESRKLSLVWICLRSSFCTNYEASSAVSGTDYLSSEEVCSVVPRPSAALDKDEDVCASEMLSSSSTDFPPLLPQVLAMERKPFFLLARSVRKEMQCKRKRSVTCRRETDGVLRRPRSGLTCFGDEVARQCLNCKPVAMPRAIVGREVVLSSAQLRFLATYRYIQNCVLPDCQRKVLKLSSHGQSMLKELQLSELTEAEKDGWRDYLNYFGMRGPGNYFLNHFDQLFHSPWKEEITATNRASIAALNRACVNYMQLVPDAKAEDLLKWLDLFWLAVLQHNSSREVPQYLADIEWCTFLLRWKIFQAINPQLPLEQLRQSVQATDFLRQICAVHIGSPALRHSISAAQQAGELRSIVTMTLTRFNLKDAQRLELEELHRHLVWLRTVLTKLANEPCQTSLSAHQTACPVQSILQLTYRPMISQEEQKVIAQCVKEVDAISRGLRETFYTLLEEEYTSTTDETPSVSEDDEE